MYCLNARLIKRQQQQQRNKQTRGVRGRKSLKSLIHNHLPLTVVGRNPDRYFGLFDMRKFQAFQLAYACT
jgi:hypothetical protein